MRLCRLGPESTPRVALYDERRVVPLTEAAVAYYAHTRKRLDLPDSRDLLDFLPPAGPGHAVARLVSDWLAANPTLAIPEQIETAKADLLVPVPRPDKIFLLARNYADHAKEVGGTARERDETFPWVFLKPPSTTLTHPGRPVRIPKVSPEAIDWELELAVVIGQRRKDVSEAEALKLVAGYTIVNDISNRRFRPNPNRKPRERDAFFDWMHGKWFDTFCPCGPCIAAADGLPDPQALSLELRINGEVKQHASTAQMIFPVAALIAFVSQICTLEPGDLISTGTPSGVGHATGTFLKPGDVMVGSITGIGTLTTPVVGE
jgi:2,4-diketo-3-deoxy-L-fuconate hydrolase